MNCDSYDLVITSVSTRTNSDATVSTFDNLIPTFKTDDVLGPVLSYLTNGNTYMGTLTS